MQSLSSSCGNVRKLKDDEMIAYNHPLNCHACDFTFENRLMPEKTQQ